VSGLTPPVGPQDHAQGSDTAPVTLVEYGDYQCPYCGRAYPIVKEIVKQMGPKLRFIFRNFPLSEIHPDAEHAAEAAESAAAQGKFWEMHNVIFENQRDLSDKGLESLAKKAKVDVKRLRKDLEEETYGPRVRTDFMSGVRSGVNGTPTFFINGERHEGSWDLPSLLAALRAAG
jgi:protein-disulfide isomerase